MNWQRLAVALSALNVVILLSGLVHERQVTASEAGPVLRGRALEIVDERGRVRAELKVLPADATVKMPDGTIGYPETVLLRLIDSQGGPNVKLAATEDGAALVLGGESGYVQVLSRGGDPYLKIVTQDDREHLVKPSARP